MLTYLLSLSLLVLPLTLYGQYGPYAQRGFNSFNQQDDPEVEDTNPTVTVPGAIIDEESEEPDSGNWYNKLHWWKEAKRVYTIDIHDAMEHVKSIERDYDERKKILLGAIETYYTSLPVKRGEAIPIIDSLLEDIKKRMEPVGDKQPTKEEQAQILQLQENQKTLTALRHDFDQFNTLVQRLNEAFNDVVPKEIKETQNYDEKALDYFERIEKVYDDQKAQGYYDIVENCLENIRAIIGYLIGPLQQFIDETWKKMQPLMPQIKSSIEDLEKKGIHVRVLTELEKQEQAAQEKAREAARLKALAEKKTAEERRAMPWWKRWIYNLGDLIGYLWNSLKSLFSAVGSLFSGGGKPVNAPPPKPVSPQPTPTLPKSA